MQNTPTKNTRRQTLLKDTWVYAGIEGAKVRPGFGLEDLTAFGFKSDLNDHVYVLRLGHFLQLSTLSEDIVSMPFLMDDSLMLEVHWNFKGLSQWLNQIRKPDSGRFGTNDPWQSTIEFLTGNKLRYDNQDAFRPCRVWLPRWDNIPEEFTRLGGRLIAELLRPNTVGVAPRGRPRGRHTQKRDVEMKAYYRNLLSKKSSKAALNLVKRRFKDLSIPTICKIVGAKASF